jgi:hypothetical protein
VVLVVVLFLAVALVYYNSLAFALVPQIGENMKCDYNTTETQATCCWDEAGVRFTGQTHRVCANCIKTKNDRWICQPEGSKRTGRLRYQSIKDKEKKMSNGGYISQLTLSREEGLVSIAAHELRHLWQKNHPGKRGKVWGAKGQYSERDADAYAIRKVREWRRLHAPKGAYPVAGLLID